MVTPSISRTRQTLRLLVAEDGFEVVYTELLHEMEEQYRFLHAFFTKTPPIAAAEVVVSIADVVDPPAQAPVPTTPVAAPVVIPVTPAPKKVVRRGRPPSKVALPSVPETPVEPAAATVVEPVVEPTPERVEPAAVVEPVAEVAPPAATPAATPAKRTAEFTKEQQRALVAAKAAELKAQGIDGSTYLTKENLTKWLREERLTYQKIAQRTGVPETQVSALAKMYCLSSYAKGVVAGAYQTKKDLTK